MGRIRVRSKLMNKDPLDLRPDCDIIQERKLFEIEDPYITVTKGYPQLVDHIVKSPLKSVTPTIVKISDPITNKPLCVLTNPKVPFRGFTSI